MPKSVVLKNKKGAIVISYLSIFFNTFTNLILTPLYLEYLGIEAYGLYQMVYSMAHYILIMDLGITTTMTRFISLYMVQKDKDSEERFVSHCALIVSAIIAVIVIIGLVLNHFLLDIYPSIELNEADLAHSLFLVMIATIAITVICHFLEGIIMAYEYFVVLKSVGLAKMVLKFLLIVSCLLMNFGILSIAIADFVVTILSLLFYVMLTFAKINYRIHFHGIDRKVFISILPFMFAIFLQSIVSYVNNTVDKTILGIMMDKTAVAIYSVGLTFITLFNSLPHTISGMFLPKAIRLVTKNASRRQLTDFVIRPGRLQFLVCGGIICSFVLFGREFIQLWTKKPEMQLAWNIALIIMVPNMIALITGATIPILDAKNKRMFRSIAMVAMSVVNVCMTIVLVRFYGSIGAPIGTGFSYLIGYGVVMDVYYEKVIGIDVLRMFKEIISKTWVCLIISSLLCYPLNLLFQNASWLTFIIKVLIFMVVLFALMMQFGFSQTERNDVNEVVNRFIQRKDA